jgi:hypothetical protein
VAVASNPLLADLDGLARLTQVKGDLLVDGLPSLASLAPLAGIKSVGLNLVVTDNAQLQDLAGLEGLETVGLLLNVAYNPQLQSLKVGAGCAWLDWAAGTGPWLLPWPACRCCLAQSGSASGLHNPFCAILQLTRGGRWCERTPPIHMHAGSS